MFRMASQIDAGFQNLLFAQYRAAELLAVFIAMSRVYVEHSIAQDLVAGTDEEDAAKFHAVQLIILNHDILRPHLDAGVVEHNAEMTEWIILGRLAIGASIAAHRAVMKAVQVDAFAVDLFEIVVLVDGLVDVAGGVDAHRSSAVLDIHQVRWESDAAAAITHHVDLSCMAHLNGVASNIEECVLGDLAAAVTGRHITGVGPDRVAADVAKHRIGHGELIGSLFEENPSGGIVSALGIQRSAVTHGNMIELNVTRVVDDDREAGDTGEIQVINR